MHACVPIVVIDAQAEVPSRFRTSGRIYAEVRWSSATAPNGTERQRVLRRHFLDLIDARGDVGRGGGLGAVAPGVLTALIALAALAVVALAVVLLLMRRRRRRFERR